MTEQQAAAAVELLREAWRACPDHMFGCAYRNFRERNQHLPSRHPVWDLAPQCSCWLGKAKDLLAEIQ